MPNPTSISTKDIYGLIAVEDRLRLLSEERLEGDEKEEEEGWSEVKFKNISSLIQNSPAARRCAIELRNLKRNELHFVVNFTSLSLLPISGTCPFFSP